MDSSKELEVKTPKMQKLEYQGYIPPDILSALTANQTPEEAQEAIDLYYYKMECFIDVVRSGLPKEKMMEEFRNLGVKSPEKLGIVKHLFG
jgi:hypothetical protein